MGRSSCFNYFLCPDVSDETPALCGVRSAARQLITSIACRSMMLYTAKGGLSTHSRVPAVSAAHTQPSLTGWGCTGASTCWESRCTQRMWVLVAPVSRFVRARFCWSVLRVCFCVLKGENCGICAVWRPCVHTQNALLALLPSEFQTLAPDDHFPRLCV